MLDELGQKMAMQGRKKVMHRLEGECVQVGSMRKASWECAWTRTAWVWLLEKCGIWGIRAQPIEEEER